MKIKADSIKTYTKIGRDVVMSLKRDVPSLSKVDKAPKWIAKPIPKEIVRRIELRKIAAHAKIIRAARLKAERFHPKIAYDVPFKHITLVRRESALHIDEWITLDNWDDIVFQLEEHLSRRIRGIINRQKERGYFKFGLRLHADKRRISGDKIQDIDMYVTTHFDKDRQDIVLRHFIELHGSVRKILTSYEWHIDTLYVIGDKAK